MTLRRIAFVDSWLQAVATGSGTAVAIGGLGAALQKLGHTVERIAPPPDRLPLTLRRILFNLRTIRALRRAPFDLVVGFDIDGSGFALAPNKPYVVSIKGVIAEEMQHEGGRIRALFEVLSRIEGWNARRAERVLATSDYCRRMIHRHYGVAWERIAVVPEGIDLPRWQAALQAVPPRCDARPTILCVARQYPRKHVADLIAAAPKLLRRLPDLQLHIVGDGPEHANLVQQATALGLTERIRWSQNIGFAALVEAYAHADVFCLPSRQEGFGIVFLEAMAAGLPVVSTSAAAIPEVVVQGATGLLIAPGDINALAGALFILLSETERRTAYAARSQERIARYDWQRIAEQFVEAVRPQMDTDGHR